MHRLCEAFRAAGRKVRSWMFRSGETVPQEGQLETARTGKWGEAVAEAYLQARGYRMVGKRVRVGRGEIDLLAVTKDREGAVLVFVEVKTRGSEFLGGPEAALDRRKRNALQRSALTYLRRVPGPVPRIRFDLVAVVGNPDSNEKPVIRHTPDVMRLDVRLHPEWLRTRKG